MEAIEQTLNGSVSFGNKVSCTISRNGDLVHRMYLEYNHAAADAAVANPGSAIINEIEVEIGGQRIDKHYGHWMETWAQLTESNPTGANPTANAIAVNSSAATSWTKFQKMSGMGGVLGAANPMGLLYIPLQFWFCRNPGLALPLIALQYHEVKINLTIGSAANQGETTDPATAMGAMKLWADYIYLDTDERRRFAQVSHEYLIEQLQFQSEGDSASINLNFNHPVKELIWIGTPTAGNGVTTSGVSTPVLLTAANTYQLKLNGHDRFAARDRTYFTRCQVWQHHTGPGSINVVDSIAVYSFALKPEEHQPSGTCNFSRIDNAQLITSGTAQALHVYAVNYNVLRIMSGMGGLAYSN
jgi:hypothetical protein